MLVCRWSVTMTLVFLATTAIAKPGQGIPGVDVVLKKKPGGSIARTVATDATGNFELRNVEAGSYSLAINSCVRADAVQKPQHINAITRFVMANPGSTNATITITGSTCVLSEHLPLRGQRNPQGAISATGELPLDVLAAGADMDIEVGADGMITGRLSAVD